MPKMTEMQKKMYYSVGHNVKVLLGGSAEPFVGKCTGFAQPLDNEPEIASITLDTGVSWLYELFENEIEDIILIEQVEKE